MPIVMLLPGLMAGLVQGLTGFGSGIILMIFLPGLLPISQGAGVSTLTMAAANLMMVWRYRKSIKWGRLIIPFIIYSTVATLSVHLGLVLDTHILRMLLGGLLIALSLYFTLYKSASAKRYPLFIAGIFMIISGFFNGLFGIGGPLMALYFLTLARTKEEYLASIQTFFMLDTIYVSTLRFATHVLSFGDLKFVLFGMIGSLVGTAIANRLITRMDTDRVKELVYIFIGISGLYYLIFH
ncbi:sulfite exporter TauE/SafE family protein [Lacticaseibacillus zhaodongensis]|uniref:sulfite exporter TauE/SafE family protein n=1 Tax=Lacticaseibacillus zhaodongensis TaxID=2668065 RepID=UPI0012D2C6A2|nr:sulfite exporter TauE/SafE family protein [Lacticaseibacillus zhaodongensis]